MSAYANFEVDCIEKADILINKFLVIRDCSNIVEKIFFVFNIEMPGFSVKILSVAVAEEKSFFRRNKADNGII